MNSTRLDELRISSLKAKFQRLPAMRGSLIMLAGVVTAMACSWSYITDHSVRFNSFRSGRAFYRLPPLPILYDRKTGKEITTVEVENYLYPEENPELRSDGEDPPAPSESNLLWDQAMDAAKSGNLGVVQDRLHEFLELTAIPEIDEEPNRQPRRNSAFDMLDALSALRQGSKVSSVRSYLDARYSYDNETGENIEQVVSQTTTDKNLQDNWAYLQAASLYSKQSKTEALRAFQDHAEKYPHSEKNESVMYMMAKLRMESSYSYENTHCRIIGKTQTGEETDPEQIEPADKCQDENWHAGVKAFQALMRKYPNGRYFNDARGWLAYLYRRGGEQAKALAEYYRLLGHPTDRNARLAAKKSLQILGHDNDDETLDKLEDLIKDDIDAAMAYSYHRIYNHAVDLTGEKIESWCCYGENEWQEKQEEEERVSGAHIAGNHELTRVAAFASRMIRRFPNAQVSGGFVLRVAEAQLELQNAAEALTLARKALSLGLTGDLRAQAIWIKGSAEHQTKDLAAARKTFEQLISEFPKSKFAEGARRLLAMVAEDRDDLETALEQYLALGYQYDVAYFIDVLLPTDRLAKFVAQHEYLTQHNELLYALGVRYMRDKHWNEAREVFRRVRTRVVRPDGGFYADNDDGPRFAKEPDWDRDEYPYIKDSWVMQDLKTIDVLEHLEQTVESAQGEEAKAEAMYQMASYQFEADDLLFYNPAAWRGLRSDLLFDLQFGDNLRLPNESRLIFDHSQSHETLSRAISIYVETANRYPQTKAAKDALYSAAVAQERLSNLNNYWREIDGVGLFAGPKLVTYADVKSTYPRYQLPRGTDGWEPSTRTVNGGPGWAPPPKPTPKLTREQKFRGMIGRLYNDIQPKVGHKVDAVIQRYHSSVQSILNAVLAVIATMIGSYGLLLWVHFRKPEWLFQPKEVTDPSAALILQELQPTESRMEKVIGNE